MTFDLEKARADLGEIGDPKFCDCEVRAQFMEAITEIERLRLLATFPKSESGLITGLCMAIRKTEEQAAEIERLRAASIEYQNALDDVQNLKEQIETFHLRRENELRQMNEISWQNKTQAARIQELGEAHKRSGVKYAKIINELRSSVYAKIPSLQKQWDDVLAEGKIWPDADECPDDLPPIGSPYRSWQITEERIRAIQWAEEMAGDCKAGDVLRAMLEEEEQ